MTGFPIAKMLLCLYRNEEEIIYYEKERYGKESTTLNEILPRGF